MEFQEFSRWFAPLGFIIAGVVIKVSKKDGQLHAFKKYWLFFIIGGH